MPFDSESGNFQKWNSANGYYFKFGKIAKRHFLNLRDILMEEGTIKKLTDKGFGFINVGGDKDLFFHMSSLNGVRFEELYEGQGVTFNEGQGPKGPRAEDVTPS